jgi:hypothetical protein
MAISSKRGLEGMWTGIGHAFINARVNAAFVVPMADARGRTQT